MTMSLIERLEKKKMKLEKRVDDVELKSAKAEGFRKVYYLNKINRAMGEIISLQKEIEREKSYYKKTGGAR